MRNLSFIVAVAALAACSSSSESSNDPSRPDAGTTADAGQHDADAQQPEAGEGGSGNGGTGGGAGSAGQGGEDAATNEPRDGGLNDGGSRVFTCTGEVLLSDGETLPTPDWPQEDVDWFWLQHTIFTDQFTDSHGRTVHFWYRLPLDYDGTSSVGAIVRFHGNSSDPDGTFIPSVSWHARDYGFADVAVLSPDIVAGAGGGPVRAWVHADHAMVHELLQSNFNGCIRTDPKHVIFSGVSQGTCFLSAFLQLYWQDYEGGFVGECGCWPNVVLPEPLESSELGPRFKVYVGTTQDDFLNDEAHAGYDLFKHALGADVVGDFSAPGGHCAAGEIPLEATFDWMILDEPLADLVVNDGPLWVPSGGRGSSYLAAIGAGGQRFAALYTARDVPDGAQAQYARDEMLASNDPDGAAAFDAMAEATYPTRRFVALTEDFGETWRELATITSEYRAITVRDDGTVVIALLDGLYEVSGDGEVTSLAFEGLQVWNLTRDAEGRLFAVVEGELYRQELDGAWTDLNVSGSDAWTEGGTVLRVQQGQLFLSSNGGMTWTPNVSPTADPDRVLGHGNFIYIIKGDQLWASDDSGASWNESLLPSEIFGAFVSPEGDLIVAGYASRRTHDLGATWTWEHGLDHAFAAATAIDADGRMMAIMTRGFAKLVE